MPSSLVVTALIVAWLAVLVPVVARRRQLVPRPAEADLCSRVLPRSHGPASMEAAVSATTSSARPSSPSRPQRGATAVADRAEPDVDEYDDADLEADLDDGYGTEDVDQDRDHDHDLGHDEERPGPRREFRPGRGGFDPDAALAAADARYAFRRRVALGLLVAAVLTALAALVISSALWWVHVAVDLALVGYLVFLRRQTRLEEEVRERRLARMRGDRRAFETRRAQRAETERVLAEADDWGAWEGDDTGDVTAFDDEDLDGDLDEDLDDDEVLEIGSDDRVVVAADSRRSRSAGRRSGLPEGLELVEDTEDDPAFHDLDADRMPAYRRAAGA